MSTAVARNLMAEMKLLGMFEAFDRIVNEATAPLRKKDRAAGARDLDEAA